MKRRSIEIDAFAKIVFDAKTVVLVLQEIDLSFFFPRLVRTVRQIVGGIVARHLPHRASGLGIAGQGDVARGFRLLLQIELSTVGVVADEVVAIG